MQIKTCISKRKEWKNVAGDNKPCDEIVKIHKTHKLRPCEIVFLAYSSKYNLKNIKNRFNEYIKIPNNERKGNTLKNYQLKYGNKMGILLYKEKNKKSKLTIENFVRKYGKKEGELRYKKSINLRKGTLDSFIIRHGKEEGEKKYKEFCKRNSGNKSLERFIELYGESEGNKKYKETLIKTKRQSTLDYYIEKYGKTEGTEKFWNKIEKLQAGNKRGFSTKSQELFKLIELKFDKKEQKNFHYALKNKEYQLGRFQLDFYDSKNKKCIEFFGDKFHANPLIYKENDFPNPFSSTLTSKKIWERDLDRKNKIENSGIKMLIIWEHCYILDKDKVVQQCVNFLKK